MKCASARRTAWCASGPQRDRARARSRTYGPLRRISSAPSAPSAVRARRWSCRAPILKPWTCISRKSAGPLPQTPMPSCCSTKPHGTPLPNSASRRTSPSCLCHPSPRSSIPPKMSGNTSARTGSPIVSSTPMKPSSRPLAKLGTT